MSQPSPLKLRAVLPLENWMRTVAPGERGFRENTLRDYYTECTPVFERDGIYMTPDYCWIESGGKAYWYRREDVIFRLNMLNASEYNEAQINALREAIRQKVASKEQKELVHYYDCWRGCINTYRESMKWGRNVNKSLRKRISEKVTLLKDE